jgi:hypothetical protein
MFVVSLLSLFSSMFLFSSQLLLSSSSSFSHFSSQSLVSLIKGLLEVDLEQWSEMGIEL